MEEQKTDKIDVEVPKLVNQDNLHLRKQPKRITVTVEKRADFLLQSKTKCAFYDWALVGGHSCTTCKAYRGSKGKPRSGRFFVYCAAKELIPDQSEGTN